MAEPAKWGGVQAPRPSLLSCLHPDQGCSHTSPDNSERSRELGLGHPTWPHTLTVPAALSLTGHRGHSQEDPLGKDSWGEAGTASGAVPSCSLPLTVLSPQLPHPLVSTLRQAHLQKRPPLEQGAHGCGVPTPEGQHLLLGTAFKALPLTHTWPEHLLPAPPRQSGPSSTGVTGDSRTTSVPGPCPVLGTVLP